MSIRHPRNVRYLDAKGQISQEWLRYLEQVQNKAETQVQYSGIQDVTADRLLGRTGTAGSIEEISLGTGLEFSGDSLVATNAWSLFSTDATTSGGTINVTSVASTVRQIRTTLTGTSLTAADSVDLYLGTSGGVETTGYTPVVPGFNVSAGTNNVYAFFDIISEDGITWHGIYSVYISSGTTFSYTFQKTLSAALDRIQLDIAGAATFDAGTMHTWVK